MEAPIEPDEMENGPHKPTKEAVLEMVMRRLCLETPGWTAPMVQFLNDDEHCAAFLSFITLLEPSLNDDAESFLHDGPSHSHIKGPKVPREDTDVSEDLKRSYRATMLVAGDDTSDQVLLLLSSKARVMTKCLFPIFQSNSRGNLRHGCKILDKLLRLHLNDVHNVVGVNGRTCGRYMQCLLEHIEHPHVSELFLTMICKPHNAALLRVYISPPATKIMFYKALADIKIVLLVAQHICDTQYDEVHAIAAADVLLELLDRLAADDYGGIVLEPLAHSTQLLESLVTTALTPDGKSAQSFLAPPCGRRTAAIRCLLGLLEKAAQDQVVGPPTSPYQSFGSTVVNMVPNQLHVAKAFVFDRVQAHLPEILTYLQKQFAAQHASTASDHGVKHTAYTVAHPFTEFRMHLVQLLVALVEQAPRTHLATFFTTDVWRILIAWFVQYPHNNLYHHAFYRLVFLALRTDDAAVLKPLLQHAKLVTTLIDIYRKDPTALQAATLPPDAFLRSFLQSHATWRSFDAELCDTTQASVVKGLGIPVPTNMMRMMPPPAVDGAAAPPAAMVSDGGSVFFLGSEFAWKLGFVDDEEYEPEEGMDKKKKKKNKGKKKSLMGSPDHVNESEGDELSASAAAPGESGDDAPSTTTSSDDVETSSVGKKKKRKKHKK
ncbi:hypothetical protein DYB32_004839 [Aphanomyces invadans]|uniref:Uncharacterized protein n=1 Tax=Aphanomyces invadans TaxID=157072 RepID=A0A3R6YZ37_9STRA|nr:hypothetical protein DYB32_004839 [Aphanomyces invadans]